MQPLQTNMTEEQMKLSFDENNNNYCLKHLHCMIIKQNAFIAISIAVFLFTFLG